MLRKKICLFFALLFLNTGVYAGEKIDAKRYVEAKVIERQPPKYPAISARKGQEGWVSLIFTVAADAKIKDIEVVNHSGVEAFVGPAVQAVSKYKYEPAIFEGKPVESVEEFRLTFQFSQTPRVAGKRFASYFRKYKKAILDKNEARASKYLARLREIKADNLYESAFINLSEYYYGVLNGHSDLELIERLREVTKVIGEEPFISKSAWSDAMRHLFTLLVKQNHYGEAVDIYNQIPDKKIYEEVRKDLA
nr:energy transducer TonB [Acidiferrobacterales bacterium]